MRLAQRLFSTRILGAAMLEVCLIATPISAQESVVTLDPANTKVTFTLGATLHTVHGSFRLKSGEIRFDPTTRSASGSIVVDATSAETGNDSRDKNMHKQVLESPKFPEIVFMAQQVIGSVPPEGKSQVQLIGTFRLHGTEHEITLPLSVDLSANGHIEAGTDFDVPYVKWGLKNPSTFVLRVSDTVHLEIHAVGTISAASAAPQ